jgi:hypothetical protein
LKMSDQGAAGLADKCLKLSAQLEAKDLEVTHLLQEK